MSAFSFPPPPPPPPKPAPTPESYGGAAYGDRAGDRGRGVFASRGRGDGSRGRGRGGNWASSTGQHPPQYHSDHRQSGSGGSHNSLDVIAGSWRGMDGGGRGQKRKRDEYHGRPRQAGPRAEVAPAVPKFGAPLPTARSILAGPSKKTNMLGLTPKDGDASASEDDDDEVAMASAPSSGLQISYGGRTLELNSREAMAAFISERKKNFPTAARIAARKQEELKRQQEALRRKLEASKTGNNGKATGSIQATGENKVATKPKAQQSKVEKLREKLAKAEAKAAEKGSGANTTPMRPGRIAADGPRDASPRQTSSTAPLVDYSDDDDPAGAEASDESSDLSSTDDESDDDTGPDQEGVGKPQDQDSVDQPVVAHETQMKHDSGKRQACRAFAATGRCKFGQRCRYLHEGSERPKREKQDRRKGAAETPKRKSLYERLVEQELKAQDSQVLDVIKYLGHNGHLNP